LAVVRVVALEGVETVVREVAAAPSGVAALLMGAAGKWQEEQQGEEPLLHVRDTMVRSITSIARPSMMNPAQRPRSAREL
jgi:hypothetical protein